MLAGCVIINPQGKVLLIHRNTATHVQWEIPGGKIEDGEESARAAEREIEEELGVHVKIERELGRKDFENRGETLHYVWFLARIVEGEPRIVEDHVHDKLDYFSQAQLEAMHDQLSNNTRNFVAAWKAGELDLP